MRSIFRFKQGDRVEVLSKSQVSSGSWLCGTLISGNGHTYLIQFESPSGTRGAATTGRVPRKAIRPRPPMKVKEKWVVGDLVEVYDQSSWKSATIVEARGGHIFLVRLLGNSHNVETDKSCLRIPQSWRDGEWSVIQKVSEDTEISYSRYQLDCSVANDLKERDVRDSCTLPDHAADFQVSHMIFPRSLKRTATCNIPEKRYRAAEKEGRPHRMALEGIMQSHFEEEENIPFLQEEEETAEEDGRFLKAKVDMKRFIFRFKKGDKVEVLSKSQVPSGSWLCGTLISGNGHTYLIQFECPIGTGGAATAGRVPRKAIRPRPPVKVKERWAAGDLVEVYDQSSWKLAKVLKASGIDMFLVGLLGTSHNVEAHESYLRIPQSWHGGEWSEIQKVSEDTEKSHSEYQLDRSYHESVANVLKERDVRDSNTLADHDADQMAWDAYRTTMEYQLNRSYQEAVANVPKERDVRNNSTLADHDADQMAWDAYRTTMESLGTIGHMSWDHEEKLTDLRLMLKISNEQHLVELKKYNTPLLLSCYIPVLI